MHANVSCYNPPVPWLRDTLAGLLLLAILNAALARRDPGMLAISPHPLLALVALVSIRHGLRGGVGAGAIQPDGAGAVQVATAYADGRAALSAAAPGLPLLIVVVGAGFGALRQRQLATEEVERRRAAEARAERDAARTRLTISEQARRELERRLVDPAATIALLHDALERLEAMDEATLHAALVDIALQHLHADAASLYIVADGRLARRAWRGGWAAPPEERGPDDGLPGLALRERRVVSARDLLSRPELRAGGPAGLDTVIAAPILGPDGAPIAVICVESMPLVSLTASAQRVLGVLASYASRAVERARYARGVREKAIYDEAVGALRYHYFTARLAEEFERARRYGEPFGILILEILSYESVPPGGRETLRRALAQVLKNTLRAVDMVHVHKDERSFAVTLPHTGPDGAAIVKDRVYEEIERLAIEPYRRAGRLDYAVGVACYDGTMLSPADLVAAAENRAASPMPARAADPALAPPEARTGLIDPELVAAAEAKDGDGGGSIVGEATEATARGEGAPAAP